MFNFQFGFAIHHYSTLPAKKKASAACRGFTFPRLHLRANLDHQKNGEGWQDRGDKMALTSKAFGVAEETQQV